VELTVKDRSNYLKGLLILIGKDKIISEAERNNLMEISAILGFDREFCKNAIDEILFNEYIIEEPPLFSNMEIAKAFVRDGMNLAFSDRELHLYELNWLNSVVETNKIDPGWKLEEFNRLQELSSVKHASKPEFEISSLIKRAE